MHNSLLTLLTELKKQEDFKSLRYIYDNQRFTLIFNKSVVLDIQENKKTNRDVLALEVFKELLIANILFKNKTE